VSERTWYLGVTPEQVADRAILVGDRARIDRVAARLDGVTTLNDDRGLWVVTGVYDGMPVTAAACGMGAPQAAIVLHELQSLGAAIFLRLGTAMRLPPGGTGEFLLAEAAIRGESTSGSYVPAGYPACSDHQIQAVIRAELSTASLAWRAGMFASYDGFYTQMLALRQRDQAAVAARVQELCELGVLAVDMETSAVLAIARALGARAASLCLATVAWEGAQRMDEAQRSDAEDRLVDIGLATLKALGLGTEPDGQLAGTTRLGPAGGAGAR